MAKMKKPKMGKKPKGIKGPLNAAKKGNFEMAKLGKGKKKKK